MLEALHIYRIPILVVYTLALVLDLKIQAH